MGLEAKYILELPLRVNPLPTNIYHIQVTWSRDQSEASIQVTWSVLTNQRPVLHTRHHNIGPVRGDDPYLAIALNLGKEIFSSTKHEYLSILGTNEMMMLNKQKQEMY